MIPRTKLQTVMTFMRFFLTRPQVALQTLDQRLEIESFWMAESRSFGRLSCWFQEEKRDHDHGVEAGQWLEAKGDAIRCRCFKSLLLKACAPPAVGLEGDDTHFARSGRGTEPVEEVEERVLVARTAGWRGLEE